MEIITKTVFAVVFYVFWLSFLSVTCVDANRNFLHTEGGHTQSHSQIWLIGSNPECNVDCRGSLRRKFCGSNGITFNSECEERKAKCLDPMLKTTPGKCKEATCFQARDHALQKMEESRSLVYVPNCTDDGLYAQRQCNLEFRTCWCVSPDGKLIDGSAVEDSEPSCTTGTMRRSTESCTASKRASLQPSVRSQIMREYRKATPRAEVPPSGSELLRLALEWEFTHVDKNKDSYINLREVRGFLRNMRKLHARECDTAFLELCDDNHDRRISDEEWMTCLFTIVASPVHKQVQPESSTTPPTDILKVHRHSVGKGKKGQCSTDDRAVLIDNIRNWILTDDPLPTQSDLSTFTPTNSETFKIISKFQRLDKNKNGFLNQKERNPLRRQFRKFKYKKCFMEICDEDKDTNISKEEFVNCLSTAKGFHCGEERRRESLKSQRAQEAVIPACEDEDDRYFNQVQCHRTTGYCWCASRETGRPIPGTSKRGEQPECTGTVTTTSAPVLEIPGCNKPREFIQSMQNALVKQMALILRSSSTGRNSPTTFTEEVAIWYFESLDGNNDEKINRKEAKVVRKSLKGKVKPKKCLRKFMRYCDMNNNKKISQEEFSKCLQVPTE